MVAALSFFWTGVPVQVDTAMSEKSFPPPTPLTSSVRLYINETASRESKTRIIAPPPPWWRELCPKLFLVINKEYLKTQFAKDIMAGVIVGIVALPLAIAFAVASGVTPDKGLVTAVIAGFFISFLGGSRVQIGGPTGAFIVIVYGVIAQYGLGGLMISTMLAGAFLIAFGLLRLGNVIKFIPHPVIVGFTSGIAVTIFSTQIKDALGLSMTETPEHFLPKWKAYFAAFGSIDGWAVGTTAVTLAVILAGRKLFPKAPGSLVAILLATGATALFNLPVETIGSRFGDLPTSFSLSLPPVSLSDFPHYLQPAFTIALLCAIESLLSAVVADGMIGDEHQSNTELIGQGVANLVTPLFGGIPATGAIARTVTNVKNGGRTPVAGIVHAATLLAIMLALGQYAKLIPMACLAGILIIVAYNMSEWRSFRALLRAPVYEVVVLVATFLLTVLVDLTVAIEIGVILAAFLFIQRMSELGTVFAASIPGRGSGAGDAPGLDAYAGLPPGVDVFEISGPFFFAAARQYQQVLQTLGTESRAVIIRMRHVPFIDATGIRTFRDVVEFMLKSGRTVLLSGVRPAVARDLRKFGVTGLVGEKHIFNEFADAMTYMSMLPEPGRSGRRSTQETTRL